MARSTPFWRQLSGGDKLLFLSLEPAPSKKNITGEIDSSDQQWQKLDGFTVRLTRGGTLRGEIYALESEPDHRARAYHTQGPLLNHGVPAAAEWISIAGRKLCLSKEDYSNSTTAGRQ
ncbi:hypothetical protein MMC14_008962 [Varicellaria rhodocarpa]|nr:hypothetical protein [Varicellaria rhodocarpa]